MRRDGDESRIKRLVWFYLSMNNTFLWGTNGCDAGKYGEKKSVLDKWYIMIVKLSMSQDFCINVSIKNWNLNMERLIIVFVLGFFFFHKILSAWMKRLNQKSSFYCYFFHVYQIRQSSASEIKLRITDKWSIISLYTWCAWASITIFSWLKAAAITAHRKQKCIEKIHVEMKCADGWAENAEAPIDHLQFDMNDIWCLESSANYLLVDILSTVCDNNTTGAHGAHALVPSGKPYTSSQQLPQLRSHLLSCHHPPIIRLFLVKCANNVIVLREERRNICERELPKRGGHKMRQNARYDRR